MRVLKAMALLLVVLLPTGAWAAEPWPTLRQFLQFSQRQQEDYVRAYMWGAGFALNKAGMALDDCQGADKAADEIAAELRALAITGSLAEQKRSANRLIGDLLFDGCRFLRERL